VRAAIPNLVEVDGKLGRIQRAILAQVYHYSGDQTEDEVIVKPKAPRRLKISEADMIGHDPALLTADGLVCTAVDLAPRSRHST
jgi:hypothetical protein